MLVWICCRLIRAGRSKTVTMSTDASSATYNQLQQYLPPAWAQDLSHRPSTYVQVSDLASRMWMMGVSLCLQLYNPLTTSSSSFSSLLPPPPPSSSSLQLATRQTPIHPWRLPGLPQGFQVSVKRDDMTGSVLGGNKVCRVTHVHAVCSQALPIIIIISIYSYEVRKLEFLLADALEKGCDTIVTCGGIQSNHARATAVASRQLGMQPHLLLRWQGEIVRRFFML